MIDTNEIKGWGIDANPKDNPAYPMRNDTPADHFKKGMSWDRPTKQKTEVEILHSNERPNLTAVFSTTEPPEGINGMIRRFAFKYSESDLRHWGMLLMADRIQMVGETFLDIFRGKFPNLYKEMGWKMQMKYNKRNFLLKISFTSAIIVGIIALIIG